jgi:hypothetical protein
VDVDRKWQRNPPASTITMDGVAPDVSNGRFMIDFVIPYNIIQTFNY